MIEIKLPVIKKELKNDEIIITREDKKFGIDTSIVAQERFEINFPELAKNYDLFDFIEKLEITKDAKLAVSISRLKVIFCLIETDMTFKQFLQLFDFSVPDYTEELVNKLKNILELALKSSSEKN